jgi:hypothetical protein
MGSGLDDWIYRTLSVTIILSYSWLEQLTIHGCLRLAPFLTGLRVSSLLRDWLGSDLRVGHFFSFRWPLVNSPQLNTELSYDWITCDSFFSARLLIRSTGNHGKFLLPGCCHGNVLREPLASNGLPLRLYYSGFQASCHNILYIPSSPMRSRFKSRAFHWLTWNCVFRASSNSFPAYTTVEAKFCAFVSRRYSASVIKCIPRIIAHLCLRRNDISPQSHFRQVRCQTLCFER